jgi:hypothetical protein
MGYGRADRVPFFEEGLRDEVLRAWRKQGMPSEAAIGEIFSFDRRVEIMPELDPLPELEKWPTSLSELEGLRRRLDVDDPERLPADWPERVRAWRENGETLLLRVNRGFFQTMGVSDWRRFSEVIYLIKDDPRLVHELLELQAVFGARLAERVLQEVKIDAAIFSEPIAGSSGSLISPRMYEEFVLPCYDLILEVLRRHGVKTIIFRTYANASVLLPSVLKRGFNCLWACEINTNVIDYCELRREYGGDLRLIGGIDVDVLRLDQEAIRREVEEKVPPLLEQGGYVPLANGRVREYVPYENYVYYRELLERIAGTRGGSGGAIRNRL